MIKPERKTTCNGVSIKTNEFSCNFFNRTVKLGAGIAFATYSAYYYPVITAVTILTGLTGLANYAIYRTVTNRTDNNPDLIELQNTEEMTSILIVNPSKLEADSDFQFNTDTINDDDATIRITCCSPCTCYC